jgi:hypothetical protein
MGNSLKFEFDFDEVFEGIKQGVIRELSEMEFDAARDVAISQVKSEVKKEIDLTWGDKSQLKEDIKSEIKDKVFGERIREVQGRYVTQFENYISEQLSKNPDRLKELRKEIVHSVSDDVHDAVYKSVRRDVQSKVNNWLNTMSGFGVKIQGSNHTISKEEYEELLDRDRKLTALENGGVDNWEWYDESLAQFYADDED